MWSTLSHTLTFVPSETFDTAGSKQFFQQILKFCRKTFLQPVIFLSKLKLSVDTGKRYLGPRAAFLMIGSFGRRLLMIRQIGEIFNSTELLLKRVKILLSKKIVRLPLSSQSPLATDRWVSAIQENPDWVISPSRNYVSGRVSFSFSSLQSFILENLQKKIPQSCTGMRY